MGEERFYRKIMIRRGLVSFRVVHKETDLHIQARQDLTSKVSEWVLESRLAIEHYGTRHPRFFDSLVPLPNDEIAPPVVKEMLEAAAAAGVGPMASVAGVIAGYVGQKIVETIGGEVVVENGGDIFLKVSGQAEAAVWAGESPFSGKIAIRFDTKGEPRGLCTSSGTVGHSLSMGASDAVTVLCESPSIADALATAGGNMVSRRGDVKRALEFLQAHSACLAALVISGDKLGIFGDLELVEL